MFTGVLASPAAINPLLLMPAAFVSRSFALPQPSDEGPAVDPFENDIGKIKTKDPK